MLDALQLGSCTHREYWQASILSLLDRGLKVAIILYHHFGGTLWDRRMMANFRATISWMPATMTN